MASWPVLVFDIESIPDVAGLRSLRQMDASVDDAAVYDAEIADRAARGKGDFMPLYLQRVLVISCVFRNADGLKVHSLVDREVGRREPGRPRHPVVLQPDRAARAAARQLERQRLRPAGAALPGLRHGVVASKYWDMGDDDREYRYNNYISRYHLRHLDLMDLLALYQPSANAPLDAMARLLRLPGKLGMDGSQVFVALQGRAHRTRSGAIAKPT
jgi:predicted PolB exonuclease-like 3'-5' exonuclease